MKKLNKRLSMMTTLAELLTAREADLEKGTWGWRGQDYWNPADKNPNQVLERNRQRAKSWPKFSIHGHNTQINLKVHCGQEIVGALRLLDPRGDMSPDHFLMLPASEDDAELFEDDPRWPQAIQECPHAQLENPLYFWAALDIIFMMAMHGFKIRTWGYNERCVFANGTLLPDSIEPYGRFAFHMDVTGNQRWIPKDAKGDRFITPAFETEGIDTTFPLKADEELLHGTPIKKYKELELPDPTDVALCAVDPGRGVGYFFLMDENGNPIPRDEAGFYNQVVGKLGVGGNGITYSGTALKNLDIPHIEAFGSEHPQPETHSHLDVVKDGQLVPDTQVQPTRQPTSLGGAVALGRVSESDVIDSAALAVHALELTHPAAVTKEMVGIDPECVCGHCASARNNRDVPGYKLDDTYQVAGRKIDYYRQDLGSGIDPKFAGLMPADDDHEIPTTDLDLEADPANWDSFCESGAAAARRSEDGDEEQ